MWQLCDRCVTRSCGKTMSVRHGLKGALLLVNCYFQVVASLRVSFHDCTFFNECKKVASPLRLLQNYRLYINLSFFILTGFNLFFFANSCQVWLFLCYNEGLGFDSQLTLFFILSLYVLLMFRLIGFPPGSAGSPGSLHITWTCRLVSEAKLVWSTFIWVMNFPECPGWD